MAIAEPTILVFTVVTKNHAYTGAGLDERSTEIRSNGLVKALRLGLRDSSEIEICMAFSVEFQNYCISQRAPPRPNGLESCPRDKSDEG